MKPKDVGCVSFIVLFWKFKFFNMMNNKISLLILGLLASPALAQAQDVGVVNPFVDNGPRFFICVIAGVLLAIGFQALLTTLSVASGISAVGNIRKKVNKSSHKSGDRNNQKDNSSDTSVIEKISSAFGIWTMITVSISLFFASFLAVKLSLVGANFIGITLGLVIWAAFFTSMLYLEVKTVTSMVGSLISTVTTGLRQSAGVVSSAFSKSSESEAKSVAKVQSKENARAMRKELEKLFNRNDLDQKINDYVNRLSPQDLDVNRIKKELKDLITDIEVKEKTELGDEGVTHRMFFETVSKTPNISKEDVKKLSGVFSEIKGIVKSDADRGQKVEMAAERFTPASQEDIDNFKKKVTQYLRGTDKKELQPEKIRQDIQAILSNPKTARGILQNKAHAVDHDTLVNILSQREDVSREDAEKYARYAEKALDYIKDHLGSGGNNDQNRSNSGNYDYDYDAEGYRDADIHIARKGEDESKGANAKRRLSEYMNSLQEKKDFNLNSIKNEFMSVFQSSGDDSESITYKLKYYNKEEMSRFLANNTAIPADKADMIAAKAVEARDTVMEKANEVDREVRMRLEQAKQEALQQAENTRKAAASAAWWLVATAILSGVASAIGGMIALESWIL